MSTDLTPRPLQAPTLKGADWQTFKEQARVFLASGLLPSNIRSPEAAVTIMATGYELGIGPLAALRTIRIINGMPTLAAELMGGLCQRDHGDNALRVIRSTNEECVVQYQRRSWERPGEICFTMADAERAGLLERRPDQKGKSNWEKYPRAMLRSRAISEACRTAFQDSILGLYTPEEIAPERVTVTPEGEVVLDGASSRAPSSIDAERVVDVQTGEVLTPAPVDETEAPALPEETGTPLPAEEADPGPADAAEEGSGALPLVFSGRIAAAQDISAINRVLDDATKASRAGQITDADYRALFGDAKKRISSLPSAVGPARRGSAGRSARAGSPAAGGGAR